MHKHWKSAVQYTSDRLREPSTAAGVAAIATLTSHHMNSDAVIALFGTVGALFGLAAIFLPEDSQ